MEVSEIWSRPVFEGNESGSQRDPYFTDSTVITTFIIYDQCVQRQSKVFFTLLYPLE